MSPRVSTFFDVGSAMKQSGEESKQFDSATSVVSIDAYMIILSQALKRKRRKRSKIVSRRLI